MVTVFKHLAIRLWAAFITGSLAALIILPLFAGILGPGWMILPALGLIAAAYYVIGVLFAAAGTHRIDRLISEAGVWERAGMEREARRALTGAEDTVDSFFFSPFSRKAPDSRLLAQIARFQLSKAVPESSSDAVIGTYLHHFPKDRDAVIKWLERVLAGHPANKKAHDIAAKIGSVHTSDLPIQRMLAQFYLSERRCDFAALQTYRQVVDAEPPLPDDMLNALADLFLTEQRADSLALCVYLASYRSGRRSDARLFAGLAACCRLVHPTPLTRPHLEKSHVILERVDNNQQRQLLARFMPDIPDDNADSGQPTKRIKWSALKPVIRHIRKNMHSTGTFFFVSAGSLYQRARRIGASRYTYHTAKWLAVGLFITSVGWLAISTGLHMVDSVHEEQQAPQPVTKPTSDPFTLQVAAFLKKTDAENFVDRLKHKGLDAYWNRTSGNNKTWYQVRISHFATKEEARMMGDDLKSRRVISDYYIANFELSEG